MVLDLLHKWQFWVVLAVILVIIAWLYSRKPNRDRYEVCFDSESEEEPVPRKKYKHKHKREQEPLEPEQSPSPSPHPKSPRPPQNNAYLTIITTDEEISLYGNRRKVPAQVNLTPTLPTGITAADWQQEGKSTRGEGECRRVLEKIYGLPFKRIRPDWLINDRTGHKMELDGYNEELKLAFEYNGEQHYVSNHFYNKTYKAFADQVYRDNLKVDICDRRGVYLITIPYNVKFEDIEGYIRYYLPETVMARMRVGN